jgi:uncharacterized repeat protein (TIGR01451 family)
VDIADATDVAALSGETTLLAFAVPKKLFLDIVSVLNANGIASTQIPAKIEGLAFGQDVVRTDGVTMHTLYVGNDNDFVPDVAGPNRWFVFGFTDADLAALGLSYTPQQITPRGPDLALTKTAAATTAVTGTDVSYTLTVSNTGLVPASDVRVADQLPAQLTLTSCTSAGDCGGAAGGPTVSFASLSGAAAQTATISARLGCDVSDGTIVVNRASASQALADPTPDDNAASAVITAVNPPPAISGLSVDQPVLWPPNKTMHTVAVGYAVTDNCDGTTCALTVTSNEGAGADADAQVVDAHTVVLRADRNGNGSGRVYSIQVSCKDSGGAVSAKTTSVVVPHNQ